MRNFVITVNGKSYQVGVEEKLIAQIILQCKIVSSFLLFYFG